MPQARIQLSAPHGIWRPIYARRQALHATADAVVLTAWTSDLGGLDLGPAVAAWRHAIGESTDLVQQHRRQAAAAAILAALAARSWARTRTALALAASRAHQAGWTAGQALTTRPHDDDTAYDASDSGYVIGSPEMSDDATAATAASTLAAALRSTAKRSGRAMADSQDDPEGDAEHIIDAGAELALAADIAVSAAYGAGLLAAYLAAGLQAVNWLTAGDGRVCVRCSDNEANGPYSLLAAPRLPAHGNCRCVLAPT